MEQTKKNLKWSSIVVLAFAALTLIELIVSVALSKIDVSILPAGAPENTVLIAKIFVVVIGALVLLPQVYIGLRGLALSKNPAPTKGHIIWAYILFGISAFSLISPVIAIFRQQNVGDNVTAALSILLEVVIFFEYIAYSKALLKEIK